MGAKEQYEARKATDEARRAVQKQSSKKHTWWFKQPDPIAKFTGWVAIYTLVLAVATIGSAVILYLTDLKIGEQAIAVNRQLKIIENEQRPWVKLEIVLREPIDFTAQGIVWVRFSTKLTNVGRTPAFKMTLRPSAFTNEDPVKMQKANCMRSDVDVGQMIFPGDNVPDDTVGTGFLPADIQKARILVVPPLRENRPRALVLYVAGCVTYFSPVDQKNHETAIGYFIGPTDPRKRGLDPDQGVVPLDQIMLTRWPSITWAD